MSKVSTFISMGKTSVNRVVLKGHIQWQINAYAHCECRIDQIDSNNYTATERY